MISQQRIDELLFSEPNMVRIIRQVEQEATAELRERAERAEASERPLLQMRDELLAENEQLRAERDALRALLADIANTVLLTCENVHHAKRDQGHGISECPVVERLVKRIDAALREGKA